MATFQRQVPGANEEAFVYVDVHSGGVSFTEWTSNMIYGGSADMGSRTHAQVLAGDVPHGVPADLLAEVQAAVRALPADAADSPDAFDAEGIPRIVRAAFAKDLAEVERLIAAGADVDATGRGSYSALRAAALEHQLPIIDALIAGGAHVAKTPLKDLFRWREQHAPYVQRWLAAGAQVTGVDIIQITTCEDRESLQLLLAARPDLRAAFAALLATGGVPKHVYAVAAGGPADLDIAVAGFEGAFTPKLFDPKQWRSYAERLALMLA